jgi:hypothetical protein
MDSMYYGGDSADMIERWYGYRPEVLTDAGGSYMCTCNEYGALPVSSTSCAAEPTPRPTPHPTNAPHPCDWWSGNHGCDHTTYCQAYMDSDDMAMYNYYYDFDNSADMMERWYGYKPEVNHDSGGSYMCMCNNMGAVQTSSTSCAVVTEPPTRKYIRLS